MFDLADYFNKKIGLIRHFNQNILKKTCWGGKIMPFFPPHDQDRPKFARLAMQLYLGQDFLETKKSTNEVIVEFKGFNFTL